MRYSEGQAVTSDGVTLYTQTWLPDTTPKAMLAYIHGLGEHSGRYRHIGETMAAAGYGFHMGDLRGHGRSPGKRGHIMDWAEYQYDLQAILDSAQAAAPEVTKHFYGGHSMGGLIALDLAVENTSGYRGVITSAPGLGVAWKIPAWKVRLAYILSRVVPTMPMSTELPPRDLCRDPQVVEAYDSDPLVHDRVSVRQAAEALSRQVIVRGKASKVHLPLLILYGTDDNLANTQLMREFYEAASSQDKTLIPYDKMFHEVCNEFGKDQVLSDMIGWMDERV